MLILVTSFRKVLLVLFIVFPIVVFSQTETKLFVKPGNVYQLYYPTNWKVTKSQSDLLLQIPKTEGQLPCTFTSHTQDVAEGFTNASIKELAAEEERITKEAVLQVLTTGVTVNYLKSSFEIINGKEWWIFEFVANYSNFKYYTRVWKTVHNHKAYSLEFSANDNNFANNFDQAQAIVNSYSFLNKDETVYRKIPASDNTTASSGGQKIIASPETIPSKEKDQGPVAQPGKIITSIPSSVPAVDSAVVVPVGSTDQTEQEYRLEEEKKEADLIKACAPTTIKRKSAGVIEIKLGNGKLLTLKDKGGDEDSEAYSFKGCIASFNAYLFRVGGWEEEWWILVNKTDGTKISLANEPVLSPDKKRFVCTLSGETDSGYGYNYFGIWGFTNGKPKKELELSAMTWGAGVAEWISNTSIKVEALKYDGTDTKKLKSKIATLVNGKWSIK